MRTRSWAVLSRDVFDSAVTTLSPQGIVATWKIREIVPQLQRSKDVLIVENLQDPGNFGTLIRSVGAFNMERVLATPETVNEWNPKVVRAAAGAVFHVPVERAPLDEIVAGVHGQGLRIFAAVSHITQVAEAGERSYPWSLSYDADFQRPCAILVGNEGAGLSARALALADEQVTIPCSIESLNAAVAGSILLYEVMRQEPLRGWAKEQGLRS